MQLLAAGVKIDGAGQHWAADNLARAKTAARCCPGTEAGAKRAALHVAAPDPQLAPGGAPLLLQVLQCPAHQCSLI